MAKAVRYGCDNCDADLTSTGNSSDYRLVLMSQSKTPWYVEEGQSSGFVTDMFIADPMPQPKHFCHMACLQQWLDGQ